MAGWMGWEFINGRKTGRTPLRFGQPDTPGKGHHRQVALRAQGGQNSRGLALKRLFIELAFTSEQGRGAGQFGLEARVFGQPACSQYPFGVEPCDQSKGRTTGCASTGKVADAAAGRGFKDIRPVMHVGFELREFIGRRALLFGKGMDRAAGTEQRMQYVAGDDDTPTARPEGFQRAVRFGSFDPLHLTESYVAGGHRVAVPVKQPDAKRLQDASAAVHGGRVAQTKHDGLHMWARHDEPEQIARSTTGKVCRAAGHFRHEVKPRCHRHFGISCPVFIHKKRDRNTPSNRRMHGCLMFPQVGGEVADDIEKTTSTVAHWEACDIKRRVSAMQAQGYGPGRLHR